MNTQKKLVLSKEKEETLKLLTLLKNTIYLETPIKKPF